jgi:pimeloyl-ACP methyl ester carboxylesterase
MPVDNPEPALPAGIPSSSEDRLKRIARLMLCITCGLAVSGEAGAQQTVLRRFALAPGDTIAVHEAGSGVPIVMVPGLLGSSHSFRHVTAALTGAGFRVVIIDPLGTGSSSRPQRADYTLEGQAARVLEVMDSLAIPASVLVCHSVGGSICYRAALRSRRVLGIVAINGGPDEQAATNGLRSAMKLAPLIRVMGAGSMRGRLKNGLIDSSADPSWVTESVVAAYTAPFGDLGLALRGMRGIAGARDTALLEPRLPQIGIPVVLLVGAGTAKPVMAEADIAELEGALPRIVVERVAKAGQYIQEENPAAVVEAIHALRAALGPAPDTR